MRGIIGAFLFFLAPALAIAQPSPAAPLTVTVPQICTAAGCNAGVDPFAINGLSAAQGGAINLTGGASSTSSLAGGAINILGGVPGAGGVGGALIFTGGAGDAANAVGGPASLIAGAGGGTANGAIATLRGGASGTGATGNGGIGRMFGGAALSTNGAGGAANTTGGAGAGTGAGGPANSTGGASGAGATGNGGAVTATGGAALSTNGNGGAVTLRGGAGTGTGVGGSVTLTPGASAGGAGTIQLIGGTTTTSTIGLLGASGLYTWTGTNYGQAIIGTPNEVTWTGTTGNPGSPIPLGLYFHMGSLLDTSAAGQAAGAYINLECFTGCKGGLISYLGNTFVGQVPGAGGYSYYGANFSMSAHAADGAAGGGHVTGLAVSDFLTNNATGWGTQYGIEVDVGTDTGSASVNKHGVLVVLSNTDAVQGSGTDAAYLAISQHVQTSSSGWQYGLDFSGGGRASLAFPVATTGTLIHAGLGALDSSVTVGSLIDLSAIGTVSNWIFRANNFTVDGVGDLVTNGYLKIGSTAMTLAANELGMMKISASGSAPGAGTVKFDAVAGANAGSCKIIVYAGTSLTPVTMIDNVGAGC